MSFRQKYIGDRAFYRKVFSLMLPVLIQNVITNFVSLLDNIMVGRIGTEQMSGVAITNQLLFVFSLATFGGLAGAGIFTAQFYGKGDDEGVKNSMRAKAWIEIVTVTVFATVFLAFGRELISLFIHEGEDDIDLGLTLGYGMEYLRAIMISMPLFAAINVYSTSYREIGHTRLPMIASLSAVGVNLFLNWVLIYGKLGAPALGVTGAAVATNIARVVELSILAAKSNRYFKGVWSTLRVPRELIGQVTAKCIPLLINELLWSSGMTTLIQTMSMMGIEVVSAENICNTISNLFFCSFFATGSAIAIIVGQLLGAGELERAVEEDRKLIAFALALSTATGLVMILIAPLIPEIYKTTPTVKHLAVSFIMINAMMMPSNAFTNSCFFTLRSGGKVFVTFLYDSVYLWVIAIPVTQLLVRFSALDVVTIYAISYAIDLLKCVFGYILVKRKSWVNNLVADQP